MKTGILTYQRAENYGAMLQAYALKRYLEKLGHSVEMVDYWPDYHARYFSLFSPYTFQRRSFAGKGFHVLLFLWSFPWMKRRQKKFHRFMARHLGLSGKPKFKGRDSVCDEFEVVLYGSDQIWRKQPFPKFRGFDKWYFGSDNVKASKKITYAASTGPLDETEENKKFLKKHLNNFDLISVRENDLKNLIEGLGFFVTQVLDPVFLLGRNDWQSIISPGRKEKAGDRYILFYNLLNTRESRSLASTIAKRTGLKIKEVSKVKNFKITNADYIKSAGVEEFLSLINNAELVLSNSFHGVAMSILLHKQFYAIGMQHKAGRVTSLLTALEIEDRYLADVNATMPDGVIDFDKTDRRLEVLKKKSEAFLHTAMGDDF